VRDQRDDPNVDYRLPLRARNRMAPKIAIAITIPAATNRAASASGVTPLPADEGVTTVCVGRLAVDTGETAATGGGVRLVVGLAVDPAGGLGAGVGPGVGAGVGHTAANPGGEIRGQIVAKGNRAGSHSIAGGQCDRPADGIADCHCDRPADLDAASRDGLGWLRRPGGHRDPGLPDGRVSRQPPLRSASGPLIARPLNLWADGPLVRPPACH
jgi:hypothetical protein